MRVDAITTAVAAASLAASGLMPSAPAFAPAPRTPEEFARRQRIDRALEAAWASLDGHCTDAAEEALVDAVAGEFGSTYGEVSCAGARTVFEALGLYDDAAGATFADLGSGVGKMVAQAFLELDVAGAAGVELSPTRHGNGVEAMKRLAVDECVEELRLGAAKRLPGLLRRGDLLAELPALGATHAYCASLLFDDPMLERLGEALDESDIVRFAALTDVPTSKFQRVHKVRAHMSWNPATGGTDVFVFDRR
eukprot:CAMPEP_0119268612 /NCGR_PEP_ID=MMETSP1329-20130426/6340_1 /TAXON_ID=114041 /ORGANISM="Genus nov. species nov., Strain RCC1024" /LENGTH=250 /DNA_ID=CAMNT_0007268591 /DNA_START=167 /DNA_END=916 /DNA_ORIENTATION=-